MTHQPVDLAKVDLPAFARAQLERLGIDPDNPPIADEYTLADHLRASAETTFAGILPPRFRNADCDHPTVVGWVKAYLADPAASPSLLIKGPVGTGKTHQAVGALRRVVFGMAARSQRITYRFTSHPEFNAAMRPGGDQEPAQVLAEFQSVDLLVLDDLGAGKATEWTEDTLHRLIDARWGACLPTIATTNLDRAGLHAAVDERVVSRMATATQVGLIGDDRRRAGQ